MLKEINNNADRNVELVDDRIKQLKAVVAKADRELKILRSELEKVENSAVFQEKLNEANAAIVKQTHHKKKSALDFDSLQTSLFVTEKGNEAVSAMHAQMELPMDNVNPYQGKNPYAPSNPYASANQYAEQAPYDNEIPPSARNAADTIKAADHALAAAIRGQDQIPPMPQVQNIPVITPNVYLADTPVKPKKTFAEQVKELHALGETDEAIAIKLSRSVQEVKFALEF